MRIQHLRALTIAIAVIVVVLTVVITRAQGNPPPGSYSRTCSQATMIGSVLTAKCKDQNGIQIHTRLYVRSCVGDITNVQGELVCASRRLPPGSYGRTCNACTAEGSSLQCTCRDTKQESIKTALDLASCGWTSAITNTDGHLQCD